MRQPLLPLLPGEAQMEDHRQRQTMWQKISTYRTMIHDSYTSKPVSHWILLLLSSASMLVAFPASSLFSRIYFANGGKSKWIMSWAAVAGWPIAALILVPTYLFLGIRPTPLDLRLAISYLVLGFLSAADNLMYAYAYAYLPASTAALVASTSLVFSAFFGFVLVKNKVNVSVVNSVVIITAAMVIVALDSSSDRYGHVTSRQYAMGFLWDVVGSALHGLIFALSELVFVRMLGTRSFHVVLEQQLVVSFVGFTVTTVGTVVSGDFGRMRSEAAGFAGGESWYYQVIVWSVLTFQVGVLGSTAVVFLGSTVLAGVLNAIRVPITNIAAVALLNDPMSGFKIISLVITFWGFGSYIYGSYPMKGNHISQHQETL